VKSLAAVFGVSWQAMSGWLCCKVGAAAGRIRQSCTGWIPKPEVIEGMMPQVFKDLGLGHCILIGDCMNILTERHNGPVSHAAVRHSDETSAATGLLWCTPNGVVAVATDLFVGRASKMEACKLCCETIFSRIPSKYALMYYKNARKLRVWLPNLNEAICPTALDYPQHSSAVSSSQDRGLAPTRHLAKVIYERVRAWAMLKGVVKQEDFPLLNDAWWWALDFNNLVLEPIFLPDP
jgi:hypothetical protein